MIALEFERSYMLEIFPGLEEYWDRDEGKTFMHEFFRIYREKGIMDRLFKEAKERSEEIVAITMFDVELLLLRLKPVGDDDRPYFTEEQMDVLEDLDERVIGGPVYYRTEKYWKIVELIQNHKVSDEWNCERMAMRLRWNFEFQELCRKPTIIAHGGKWEQ